VAADRSRDGSPIAAALGPEGTLARCIPGFRFRRQQLEMAEAIGRTIEQSGVLISEAGTGTGKTFAYLVPVLLSGRKVIVSTGTRNLQDQLFHRDLPLVRDALGRVTETALLKGRGNYLCLHRLETAIDSGQVPADQVGQLLRVRDWSARTRSGDIAELGLAEHAPVWPWVTSTVDNCLGQECPRWGDCHLVEARRRAQEADVVVINHHLLCADLALKDEGFGEVLPGADCFILDEAHQLPEVASSFFGMTLSGRQLMDLARDVELEYSREAGDMPSIPERAGRLRLAAQELRLSFGLDPRRGPWGDVRRDGEIVQALSRLGEVLGQLGDALDAAGGRGKGLDKCRARCLDLSQRLAMLAQEEAPSDIHWYETHKQGFRLHRTPLDIADIFSAHMAAHPAAWVFTSATLAVGDSFRHFARQLGIEAAATGRWDSPFDYPGQALLLLPPGLPEPRAPGFGEAVARLALRVLAASRGRAFLLFTSHRALREAARWLQDRLSFPLLVQGSAPRAELLERFRRLGNGVLLGTASFWEGVDVRGEALSCVIIDKLPFASPGDPVLQARIDALRRRGGNPFRDFQLPQAVIALKQGAGRLIRDVTDRGVLVICDPRLLNRAYGAAFLESLPPMRRCRELAEVEAFFSECATEPSCDEQDSRH
jgi:ATP-dependent DNA helicase DinG